MSQQDNQQAKNERITKVLKMLQEGIPRQKIADQFGYSTWKSLDIYMRRHGFSWDAQSNLYTQSPPKEDLNIGLENKDTSPEEIVRLFSIGILDAREIAKRTGFSGHKDMAAYMLRHGYIWSAESLNYINPTEASSKAGLTNISEKLCMTSEGPNEFLTLGGRSNGFDKYYTLLEFLWESRDKLIRMVDSMNDQNKIRVYNIPGKAKTKSIFLSDGLSELMLTLCQEHSLSQRQGYEAALVEYLMKYGYQDNIKQLLNSQEKSETPNVQ